MGRIRTSSAAKTTKQKSKTLERKDEDNTKPVTKKLDFTFNTDILDVFSNTDDGAHIRQRNSDYVHARYPEYVKPNTHIESNIKTMKKKKNALLLKPKITTVTGSKKQKIKQKESLVSWKKDVKLLKKWMRHTNKQLNELKKEYDEFINRDVDDY
jgi:hypothetical protein